MIRSNWRSGKNKLIGRLFEKQPRGYSFREDISMTLEIQRSFNEQEERWEIRPEGEVDISNAPLLRSALDEAFLEKQGDILLRFDGLSYMDSTGLGVIIGAYGRMKDNGFTLTLHEPRENITKLLRITGLDRLLCPELCES
ncbi:MAG: anti-sigma factor antagonist [Firmicutes bacterium HGW-Firmicutes-11]|nr:MAG: anti-sigma factor antagonist [Firmicutes bacterium HGW-Firmicutes-11]